jgi:IS6 family transposase
MQAFRYRRFAALVILQCVRWYAKYAVSYRQLAEMMAERCAKRSVVNQRR